MPEAGASDKASERRKAPAWHRLRQLIVHRILRLDDTPHRIALGVALGFLVGATPTLGVQMVIYVALAALFGANKMSGILPVWLSNPITAVPLYYGNWWLGRLIVTGRISDSEAMRTAIAAAIQIDADKPFWSQLFDPVMWRTLFDQLTELGLELWVGSLVVGSLCGAAGYWITLRAVRLYRQRGKPRSSQTDSVS